LCSISNVKKGGFLDYWKTIEYRKISKFNRQFTSSEQEEKSPFDSLNLVQTQSAFYLFLVGIIVSSLIFVFEIMFAYTVYPRLWQPGLWQNSIIATDLQSTDRSYGTCNAKAVGL
jgi:hypothetical protein